MKKQPTAAKNSDFVVNPKTGRLVKINSRAYNQLLKDKILDLHTDRQKNILYDGAHAAEVKGNLKHEDNVYLHQKGDKILQYRRKLQAGELVDYILRASHIIKEKADLFSADINDTEVRELARNLLAQHLVL